MKTGSAIILSTLLVSQLTLAQNIDPDKPKLKGGDCAVLRDKGIVKVKKVKSVKFRGRVSNLYELVSDSSASLGSFQTWQIDAVASKINCSEIEKVRSKIDAVKKQLEDESK